MRASEVELNGLKKPLELPTDSPNAINYDNGGNVGIGT